MISESLPGVIILFHTRHQSDVGHDDKAAFAIRFADDSGFCDIWVGDQ